MQCLAIAIVAALCACRASSGERRHENIHSGIADTEGEITICPQTAPCENFYMHVCENCDGTQEGVTPGLLKKKVYEKIKGLFADNNIHDAYSKTFDSSPTGKEAHQNIKEMAKKLYSVCLQDTLKSSNLNVKKEISTMLKSFGIESWPLTKPSTIMYENILQSTGLRPFATISAVADPEEPKYILSVTVPSPRFRVYPDSMRQITKRPKLHQAYKNFIHTILTSVLEPQGGSSTAFGDSYRDQGDISSSSSESGKPKVDTMGTNERNAKNLVTSDIIEVEQKLAEMIHNAPAHDVYQTDWVQEWEKRLGPRFPFMSALKTDVTRANRTLANNHKVGVRLLEYFKALVKYLNNVEVRKVFNYLGWYYVREVADALTPSIRRSLNAFLKEIPRPGVAVELSEDGCIEKLIGYQGLLEKGVTYLYLSQYLPPSVITKASMIAEQLNRTFYSIVQETTWMDQVTKTKTTEWMGDLEYHIGVSTELFDAAYVKSQYELVVMPEEESLLQYMFAFKENNFLQMLRLNTLPYNRRMIWPTYSLATEGRYSQLYTSVEIPAGLLQYPLFQNHSPGAQIFGSLGYLMAETLTDGFTEEARLWSTKSGKFGWEERDKRKLRKKLNCLTKGSKPVVSVEENEKMKRMDNFEKDGSDDALKTKFSDHLGLRTSHKAFTAIMSECDNDYTAFGDDNAKKLSQEFFVAYAMLHCGGSSDNEHRVNYVLKTYKEFALAFDCQTSDKMQAGDKCKFVP